MKQQGKLKCETTGKQKGRCISIYIASLVMLCYWQILDSIFYLFCFQWELVSYFFCEL